MGWPKELATILEHYFEIQKTNANKLSEIDKNNFVQKLIEAYNALTIEEKKDILIPANGAYLKDTAIRREPAVEITPRYSIQYKWPKESFAELPRKIVMEIGEFYDRLGPPSGFFLSPISDKGPFSPQARAVPYYVPESDIQDNPAYHKYLVKKPFGTPPEEKVLFGKIAPAFQDSPPDGGGIQIQINKSVADIQEGGVLCEK